MKQLSRDKDFDFRKKTLLFIGGFMDFPMLSPVTWLIGTLYKELGYNVLLLQYRFFMRLPYSVSARLTRAVGRRTAEMLASLTKLGLNPKRLEIAGLSIGSQTMGFTAKSYRGMTGVNISRLTGLDPSGPCFRHNGPEDRLDKTDADFVEMIATNIDDYGIAAPLGHVNFYVNGGEHQPADVLWYAGGRFLSHLRSYTIWLAALKNPDSFIALQCDSVQQARERKCYDRSPLMTNLVGLKCDKKRQGIFFLNTYDTFPYFMGEKGLLKEFDFWSKIAEAFNEQEVFNI